MAAIYVRTSQGNADYVRQLAADTGLSQATVVSLILVEARRRGWRIASVRDARIIEEGEPGCRS